jgi:secreted PhoX family phosphatase
MKGNKHPKNDLTINPSGNESIRDLISLVDHGRRDFLKNTLAVSVAATFGGVATAAFMRNAHAAPVLPGNGFGGIGFDSIPADITPVDDMVAVPPGYKVELLASWGDPIMPGGPAWSEDATQDADAQAMQYGMHNDGMHYFPFETRRGPSSERGILCVNNEYTHEDILHGAEGLTGGAGVTIAKVRKSQAAHGVSILEIRNSAGKWDVVRTSKFGRRITANTPMMVSGPAAGHALMKSRRFDITPTGSIEIGVNDGYTAFGTINNCAHGYTPWGTYLTCEENWNGNFGWLAGQSVAADDPNREAILNNQTRYGVTQAGFNYQWHTVDPRLNAATNPLEPHLFGWVVEIDPFDPGSAPVKRTALGRFKHESAQVAVSRDTRGRGHRVAFYMGDDERNEYIYKFVCARSCDLDDRRANRDLLDEGTLYVAKFTSTAVPGKAATFRGRWIALEPGTETVIENPNVPGTKYTLRELPPFAGADDAEVQALILIKTRHAADAVGATMMDRPEWMALRTYEGHETYSYNRRRPLEIYCTLTNNNRRGGGGSAVGTSVNNPNGTTAAGSARPPVDVANPRPDNDYGHIIRWREDDNRVTATAFEWDIFVLAGDRSTVKTLGATYLGDNFINGVPGTGPFYQGNILDNSPANKADFGAPDGLWFDQFGRLWIQTDQPGDATGDWVNIGVNVMCCADPNTGEIRRFMTSPRNCEVTGVINTPDGRSMFVGIQHPGEDAPAANPTQFSNWPQAQFATNSAGEPVPNGPNRRPRSSVLVITREDGGVIGDRMRRSREV